MLWILLAALGAAANGSYYIATKRLLATMDRYVLAAGSFSVTGLLLLIIALVRGIPPLGDDLFPAIAVTSALNIIATTLVFRALVATDISLAVPMISFTPIFLIATSFILLQEIPTVPGIAGICVIVTGSYVLNLSVSHTKLIDPFRAVLKNQGTASMLLVAFLYSVALNFDKMVVLNSDAVFGSALVCLVLGTSFFLIGQASVLHNRIGQASVLHNRIGQASVLHESGGQIARVPHDTPSVSLGIPLSGTLPPYRAGAPAFLVMGALLTIETVTINSAFTMQIVPYVIAIKRMSILLAVAYGTLIAAEGETSRRLAGAVLMVAGAVIIILST